MASEMRRSPVLQDYCRWGLSTEQHALDWAWKYYCKHLWELKPDLGEGAGPKTKEFLCHHLGNCDVTNMNDDMWLSEEWWDWKQKATKTQSSPVQKIPNLPMHEPCWPYTTAHIIKWGPARTARRRCSEREYDCRGGGEVDHEPFLAQSVAD